MINPEAQTPDQELEALIDREALLLHTAQTPKERRAAWSELCRLVAQRSPDQVAHMEAERGLR